MSILEASLYWIDHFIFYSVGFALLLSLLFKKQISENTLLLQLFETLLRISFWSGMLYILLLVTVVLVVFLNPSENADFFNRLTGPYAVTFWIANLLPAGAATVVKIHRIQKSAWLMILLSLLMIFSFEKYVLMLITMHRDYLPSTWSIFSTQPSWWLSLLWRPVLFTLCLIAIHSFSQRKL